MSATRISLLAGTLALAASAVQGAPNLNINGLTIETGTGKTLGTLSSQGGMDEFTKLQKELVLTVIKQLGIDLETLPPAVRGQIEKPQTSNPQALQAFAKGLDLADKGQFKDAAAAFKEAARHDPGFGLAAGMARLMPNVNVGAGGGGNELRAMRRTAREEGQRHADRQLQRMNQGGGRMKDLGLSDGRGGKDKEARMDPVELVTEQETDKTKGQTPDGNARQVVVEVIQPQTQENPNQRETIETDTGGQHLPNATDYGYMAGVIYQYDGESYYYDINVMASGSPNAIEAYERETQDHGWLMDISINLAGDMLTGTSSPSVTALLTPNCNSALESCHADEAGNWDYAYDDGDYYLYSYKYDSATDTWTWIWNFDDYYYYYNNQFEYSGWGGWWQEIDMGAEYQYAYGFWVAGELTPAADIPRTGSAAYTGGMLGYTQNGDLLEGTMNWTVNFANRTVGGSFDDITKDYNTTWLSRVNVNGGWSAGQNAVSANLTGTNVSSGLAKGSFFGPNAQELGGTWRIDHTNGDKGTGIFLGKPGGSRFEYSNID